MRKKLIIISFLIVTMVQLVMPIRVWAAEDIEMIGPLTLHKEDFGTDREYKDMQCVWYEPIDKEAQNIPLIVWIPAGKPSKKDPRDLIHLSFPKIINIEKWNKEVFNAYILCPQMQGAKQGGGGNNWANKGIQNSLKGLIEYFLAKHPNIDCNNIILMGASDGANGAVQIAQSTSFGVNFSKLVILSGGACNNNEINIPTRAFAATNETQQANKDFIDETKGWGIIPYLKNEDVMYGYIKGTHSTFVEELFNLDDGMYGRNCRQ